MGAFPEWFTVFSLPQSAELAAVWLVEIEPAEIGSMYTFELRVTDPNGVKRPVAHGESGRSLDAPRVEGAPLYVIVTWVLQVEFQVEGLHTFEVAFKGEVMAKMPLVVVLAASGEVKADDSATP